MKTSRLIRLPLCLLGVLLTIPVIASGNEPLTVAASPAQSFAPSTVRVGIHVEPNEANRTLAVVAESGEYYRSSIIQLEGESAPATVSLSYPNLPGGEYEVVCVLMDDAGNRRATARARLWVTPMF